MQDNSESMNCTLIEDYDRNQEKDKEQLLDTSNENEIENEGEEADKHVEQVSSQDVTVLDQKDENSEENEANDNRNENDLNTGEELNQSDETKEMTDNKESKELLQTSTIVHETPVNEDEPLIDNESIVNKPEQSSDNDNGQIPQEVESSPPLETKSDILNTEEPISNTLEKLIDRFDKESINEGLLQIVRDSMAVAYSNKGLEQLVAFWDTILQFSPNMVEVAEIRKIVKPLVWSGLPSSIRGEVWKYLSGANFLKSQFSSGYYHDLRRRSETKDCNQIRLDIPRTFPDNPNFALKKSSEQVALFSVLKAFSLHNVHIGYSQGMSYIAAILLKQLSEEDTFWVLVSTVNLLPEGFFDKKLTGMVKSYRTFECLLRVTYPGIFEHIAHMGIDIGLYSVNWFMTLFSMAFQNHELVLRIWDGFFILGIDMLYKVGLVIHERLADDIFKQKSAEKLVKLLQHIPVEIFADADAFIESTRKRELLLNEALVLESSIHEGKNQNFRNGISFDPRIGLVGLKAEQELILKAADIRRKEICKDPSKIVDFIKIAETQRYSNLSRWECKQIESVQQYFAFQNQAKEFASAIDKAPPQIFKYLKVIAEKGNVSDPLTLVSSLNNISIFCAISLEKSFDFLFESLDVRCFFHQDEDTNAPVDIIQSLPRITFKDKIEIFSNLNESFGSFDNLIEIEIQFIYDSYINIRSGADIADLSLNYRILQGLTAYILEYNSILSRWKDCNVDIKRRICKNYLICEDRPCVYAHRANQLGMPLLAVFEVERKDSPKSSSCFDNFITTGNDVVKCLSRRINKLMTYDYRVKNSPVVVNNPPPMPEQTVDLPQENSKKQNDEDLNPSIAQSNDLSHTSSHKKSNDDKVAIDNHPPTPPKNSVPSYVEACGRENGANRFKQEAEENLLKQGFDVGLVKAAVFYYPQSYDLMKQFCVTVNEIRSVVGNSFDYVEIQNTLIANSMDVNRTAEILLEKGSKPKK